MSHLAPFAMGRIGLTRTFMGAQRPRDRTWSRRIPLGPRIAGRDCAQSDLLQCVIASGTLTQTRKKKLTTRLHRLADSPLLPGHITSNEPGFYEEGSFGIRLESVLVVKEVKTRRQFGDRRWFGFERLTMVSPPPYLLLPLRLRQADCP